MIKHYNVYYNYVSLYNQNLDLIVSDMNLKILKLYST